MGKTIFSFSGSYIENVSIEPTLQAIMDAAEKEGYSKELSHSLRSVTSEILSNITSHAFLKKDSQRSVSIYIAEKNNDTILIRTKNFIPNEKVGECTILLNKMNLMSSQELRDLQQKTLQENLDNPGSPRIGLIMIRRRACKPIICSFEPYDEEISYINFEIEMKKNIQQDFKKERTKRTPQINFDINKQIFEISGVSFPEDAEKYYSEIEQWIGHQEPFIAELTNPVIKIDLDYFNSISLKNIVRTVRALLAANPDKFTVDWYYDSDDEISHEEGIEMSEILHKKFNFIPKN